MKKLLNILCFVLPVTMIFVFAACGGSQFDERVEYDESMLEEFIENYDKTLEFTDDIVVVVLTDEASEHIDDYTVKDFSQINPAEIKKVGRNFIFITLTETGRENVLRAVYILGLRSDVKLAEPNLISQGADD